MLARQLGRVVAPSSSALRSVTASASSTGSQRRRGAGRPTRRRPIALVRRPSTLVEPGLGDDVALRRARQLLELLALRGGDRRLARRTVERDVARDLLRDLPVDRTLGLEQPHHLREVELREVETREARAVRTIGPGSVVLRRRRDPQVEERRSCGQSMDSHELPEPSRSPVSQASSGSVCCPASRPNRTSTRIVGLDVREPPRRSPHLELHRVDIAGHDLKPLLEGVDVLVHLAAIVDPIADDALMTRVNVEGTRRVLDAAAAVGVRKIVRLSTTAAYGAWATNPLPLTEDAPLRPNPGFNAAVHAAEVERLLAEWQHDHPGGDDHDAARRAGARRRRAPPLGAAPHRRRRRVRVRGAAPPFQVVHVDDVVQRARARRPRGPPRGVERRGRRVARAPRRSTRSCRAPVRAARCRPTCCAARSRACGRAASATCRRRSCPYLVFPWVVASDRLQALGWAAAATPTRRRSSRPSTPRPPSRVPSLRTIAVAAGVAAAGIATGLTLELLPRAGAESAGRRADVSWSG